MNIFKGYSKTITIQEVPPGLTRDDLIAHLAERLEDERALGVAATEEAVSFAGGMFRFVLKWNVLVPITSGTIRVASDLSSVRYHITFTQLFVVMTVMLALMMTILLLYGAPLAILVLAFPLMWLWLVGMKVVIGVPRFHGFVRRCLNEIGCNVGRSL